VGKSALTQAFHSDGTHFPKNYTMVSNSVYIKVINKLTGMYPLVTLFKVRTVSYGPGFFHLTYGPSMLCKGHELKRKNEDL